MYDVRLHSAIGYVTPRDRLAGRHQAIDAERDRRLTEARDRRKQLRQAECQPPESTVNPRPATATTPRPAIDFAAVRAALTMAAVLDLLGFQARRARGAQQRGPCPLHGSTVGTSTCFSANLNQHTFHCFKCGFKCGRAGNPLDLRIQATRQTPYDAALDLCQRLHLPLPTLPPHTRHREEETVAPELDTCTMPST